MLLVCMLNIPPWNALTAFHTQYIIILYVHIYIYYIWVTSNNMYNICEYYITAKSICLFVRFRLPTAIWTLCFIYAHWVVATENTTRVIISRWKHWNTHRKSYILQITNVLLLFVSFNMFVFKWNIGLYCSVTNCILAGNSLYTIASPFYVTCKWENLTFVSIYVCGTFARKTSDLEKLD